MANRATPQPLPVLPVEISAPRQPAPAPATAWPGDGAAESLETRLQELADSILLLARGDGVAIALSENGAMRCQAHSGNIAPPLGALIDVRSGLTGACVSSGTLLRCNDTESDSRVDREVCRALGIRAMVCVPVTLGQKVVGVFEIFSSRPQAFLNSDLPALRAKAEEIAGCFAAEEMPQQAPPAPLAAAAETSPSPDLGRAWRPVPARPWPRWNQNWLSPRMWRAVLGALVFIFGLLLLLRALRGPAPVATAPRPVQPVSAGTMSVDVPASAATRNADHPRIQARLRPAAATRVRTQNPSFQPIPLAVAAESGKKQIEASEPTPPRAVLEGGSDKDVDQLVSSVPAASPALTTPLRVSTGVTQPLLIHRVDPMYPAEARQAGIDGQVLLSATVDKGGKVSAVKVVSGNSLLAAAAVRAVRQWRYQPYELNGVPIDVAINITFNFQIPK